ncbi:MAG: hypothetical protein AAF394_08510 [Planctomycetota bacterium]
MPRALVFQFGDGTLPLQMQKIDRSKLYGSKDVAALDAEEQACELATLADDGRTLVGKGGTALGWLDADGKWCSKNDLRPHNVDGDLVEPVPSSFDAPVKLFDTVTPDEYLSHNIRLMYRLVLDTSKVDDADAAEGEFAELVKQLQGGAIFSFPYSYRGGLAADAAFLLMNEEDEPMMVVGNPTQAAFVGIQAKVLEEEPQSGDTEDASDMMGFDMI